MYSVYILYIKNLNNKFSDDNTSFLLDSPIINKKNIKTF